MLVNMLSLVTAASILVVGGILCYCYRWRLLLVIPFSIEFILNGSVLFWNHYRKYLTASVILFFLQCVMIIFLSVVLGRLLRLDIVIVLLFAINYLIFKDKRLRRIGVAASLADLVVIEAVYYKDPFQTVLSLSDTATYIIQVLVIVALICITILISRPYVKSNDTNEELKRANHLIKIFVAQVTHELRAPLDSIHHVTQLLRKEIPADGRSGKVRSLVDIGWTVSCNARNIVNNVLDMAEIEAGKTPTTIDEAFTVVPFFEKMLEVHRMIALREEMTLELYVGREMPDVIFGDPLTINQILTNLVTNALKYGSKKGPVGVSVDRRGQAWVLQVSNSGPGIPPGKIDFIFDPFVTGKTGQIQGSGLGLYIVRSKTALMNGAVGVESDPGGLTVFTVTLPLREGKLSDLPEGAEPGMESDALAVLDEEEADGRKIQVLVAEDDKLAAFLLSRFLKDMGCSCTIMRNGQELLEAVQKKCPDDCPDIIILDCHMPVLNGEETIRRLKKIPELSHIPIIVTTGDLFSDTVDRMLAAGASTYLKKPIDHLALQRAIGQYLKKAPAN